MNKLLVIALAALAGLSGCGRSHTTTVASAGDGPEATTSAADTVATAGAPSSSTTTTAPAPPSSSTTTTAPAPPASTVTTAPPPKEPSTTTTARPTTTTTRPATTTIKPAARTVTVTSVPGPYGTTVTVRGDGCAGPDYGVTLLIRDPSGQEIPGDGGASQPDGTWQLPESFNHNSHPSGDYTFAARCITASSAVVFAYAPYVFRWNG